MITNGGLDEISNVMGAQGTIPTHIAIGTGSSTTGSMQTALLTETDRNLLTDRDVSDAREVVYISDFSSLEMSGTTLREFGLFNAGSGGIMYERDVIGSVLFDGTNELQIQISHRYNRG